jgi:nucleotidyltransferase/DNA polymerase involved in DNA repair
VVVVVVVVSEGRGADDPRRVLSGEIDRNNDIFVFFFRLGIAKKAKGNNAPTKEFEARRVCVSYRHGIRMERKVYVSINLNDDRLVCRISSNLIFFSSL